MHELTSDRLIIRTPEGIQFSYELAGPISRFLAWLIDTVVMSLIFLIFLYLLFKTGLLATNLGITLGFLLLFSIQFGYKILLEWRWRGKTIGKHVMRLRVMDADGLNLQLNQVIVRNLLRLIDLMPALYLVGGISLMVSRFNQRLGDLAANTIVIRQPQFGTPDLSQLLAGKYNSFREHGHLAARVRQLAGPQEASVAIEALVRRDQLDPVARVDLFADLAEHFRTLVTFPPEATEGLSDEQYVRNIADILYRDRPPA